MLNLGEDVLVAEQGGAVCRRRRHLKSQGCMLLMHDCFTILCVFVCVCVCVYVCLCRGW